MVEEEEGPLFPQIISGGEKEGIALEPDGRLDEADSGFKEEEDASVTPGAGGEAGSPSGTA